MPLPFQKYCSSIPKYQFLLPRVWAFLLVIFCLALFNIKPLFSQEKFAVISEEKSDSEYDNKDAKTLAKISKKNPLSSKNKSELLNNSKSKDEVSKQDSGVSTSKNIFDFSEDDVAGINVLMMAVHSNDVQGVRFFSKAGGVLINQKNLGGATALHIASREGNYEIAKVLIEGGANVNVTDNEGWTPLMRANLNGHHQIVDLLITKGANAGGLNNVGESVIMHATLANCDKCLNIMLEKLNFSKQFSTKLLKEQITDSFIISRNRENPVIQGLLESYLDRLIKVSPVISNEDFKQKMAQNDEQNLNRSRIIEELNTKDLQKNLPNNQDSKNAIVVADFIDQKENLKKQEKHQKTNEIEEKFKLITNKDKHVQKNITSPLSPKIIPIANNLKTSISPNPEFKYTLKKANEEKKDFMIIANKNNSSKITSQSNDQVINDKLQKFILKQPLSEKYQGQKPVFVLKSIDKYNLTNSNQVNTDNGFGSALTKNPSYSYTKQKQVKEKINKIIESKQSKIANNKSSELPLVKSKVVEKIVNDKNLNNINKNQSIAYQKTSKDQLINNQQDNKVQEKSSLVKAIDQNTDQKNNSKVINEETANVSLESSKNQSDEPIVKKQKFVIGVIKDDSKEDDISNLKPSKSKTNTKKNK